MRERALPLRSQGALDTCGTGGDGAGTFNISTAASLVVAACGVPVVKHGNRSASGRVGSADVLEALGVNVAPSVEQVQHCLDSTGWTFLFAPAFHAATRHAVGPRRELGVPTAFNLLGPLTNPARPDYQVVGVPRLDLVEFLARCLLRLGVQRAWVVHGGGLDELALHAPSQVLEVAQGTLRAFEVVPEQAGLAPASLESLVGGDAAENAGLTLALLRGEPGSRRDAVLLNAGAALLVADRVADLREGVRLAAVALDGGGAARLLEQVREAMR
jgi:anthranilate phosphoribosyltransferase